MSTRRSERLRNTMYDETQECLYRTGIMCEHKATKRMYCSMDEHCIHMTKRGKGGDMGRRKKDVALVDEDRKTIKVRIKGVNYELEYENYFTIKNLHTKREAPLDTLPEEDLLEISLALSEAQGEVTTASSVVEAILENTAAFRDVPLLQDGTEWNTNKKGDKDGNTKVDNEEAGTVVPGTA